MNRVILHVDMNAYFASIEQKANPLLRGKPLVVVADSRRRSVILTASYEARRFGIKTGMNLWEGKKLCPRLIAVDSNSEKYLDASAKILGVLESYSDQVEMTSCDEAYLDITASQNFFHSDGPGIAARLKVDVRKATGLPCSVGVAPNKVLAKMASDRKKPDGLTVVSEATVDEFLKDTPVQDMCGIGHRTQEKLNKLGIFTCGELSAKSAAWMDHHLGFWGHWLSRMARGRDDIPVSRTTESRIAKSVGHSTTFPANTLDISILKSYLLLLSQKIAVRLRKYGLQGKTVSLYVRYSDFSGSGRQAAKKEFTDDGEEIFNMAARILDSFQPFRLPVRLLGVSVSNVAPRPPQEFLLQSLARKDQANQAMDDINRKYGKFTVKPAGFLFAEKHGVLDAPIPPFIKINR